MIVTIVGSNPSKASPDDSPFHPQTRSRSILDDWFRDLGVEYAFVNIIDEKTENNKALTTKQIREALPELRKKIRTDKVVTLGKSAEKALRMLDIDFLAMPHPSGLNRLLNDKEFVQQKISQLREYLSRRPTG